MTEQQRIGSPEFRMRFSLAGGCSVIRLSQKGVPDLLVGFEDRRTGALTTILIEVKEPKGKLTPDQIDFMTNWNGQVAIVRTVEDAMEVIGF